MTVLPAARSRSAVANLAWRSGENDGLWSSLVLAAEAYRFATTHDPAARTALATLLHGEQLRMQITGVPGLFTRQLIPPGVAGLACPTDPAAYVPSPDKTANVWVRIDEHGCANGTTHCGLDAFAGWCFLDNISQDEYVGHVFALGAVVRLVDDPELRAIAVDHANRARLRCRRHHTPFHGRPIAGGTNLKCLVGGSDDNDAERRQQHRIDEPRQIRHRAPPSRRAMRPRD